LSRRHCCHILDCQIIAAEPLRWLRRHDARDAELILRRQLILMPTLTPIFDLDIADAASPLRRSRLPPHYAATPPPSLYLPPLMATPFDY